MPSRWSTSIRVTVYTAFPVNDVARPAECENVRPSFVYGLYSVPGVLLTRGLRMDSEPDAHTPGFR